MRWSTGGQGRPVGLRGEDGSTDVRDGSAAKRSLSREHLVEHAAEGPDVGAAIDRLAARLFRRHVRCGAEDDAALGHCRRGEGFRRLHRASGCRLQRLGESEVQYFHQTIGREFDVRGFQITVHYPTLVRGVECIGDLRRDAQRLFHSNRRARDAVGEILTRHQLHHQSWHRAAIARAGRIDHAVDLRDVGVIERGERLRLALETDQAITIGSEELPAGP